MKRRARSAALVCIGALTLLSACTADRDTPSGGRPSETAGPTATTTLAPGAAAQLADRYRRSGGAHEVYGIQQKPGPGGVPLLIVWTHNPDEDGARFDELKDSIIGFLTRKEGLSLKQGYLMDVFGPKGALQHRLDARP
ncbi:hypothetical protein GTW98_15355 [Streptomyces sp. SID8375]|uniref:hypothetical protein n=1 Tax=unclassified Streptomyces TaxID=2593676 RepID=UPI0003645623|nr:MULTISPECIES: hypothetical protein [unclassified Streptomyces]MYX08160.1 hypothetical protein [Streptomyces sp. SID8375]